MDARSTRYRPLDSKGAGPPPKTRERHNSVPNGDRQKSQQPRRQSATSKPKELGSKMSPHDDASLTSPDRKSSGTRQSDGRHASAHSHESKLSSKTKDTDSIPTINVLIIGAPGCGKSSFIRNSLDRESFLPGSESGPGLSARVKLTDQYYSICFIELEIDDVDFSSERRIIWPPRVNGTTFPAVDAVFCLYDASDKDSVADVPTALTSMTNTGVRCMLLASKCDKQDSDQISTRFHDQVRRNLANVAIAEISTKTPENTQRHFLAMLHRVISSPRVSSHSKTTNASSHSSTNQHTSPRETSPKKSRSRSRSRSKSRLQVSKSKEFLLNLSTRPAVIESADEETETSSAEENAPAKPRTKLRLDTSKASEAPHRPTGPHTPISSEEQTSTLASPLGTGTVVPETPDSYYVKSMLRPVSTETADSRAYQTFLNMDEETEHSPGKEAEQLAPTFINLKVDDSPKQETGVPFKELIDKLLILPANKSDSKFVPSFLCLYRAFATPYKLLSAVVDQFVTIDKTKMVHFTKVAEMLRYLQVLAQWTATYPGDFASGPARDLALTFIQSIENSKVFAPAAREISNNLDTLIADEDFDWAFDDSPAAPKGKGTSSNHKKTPTTSSTSLRSSSNENISRSGRKASHKNDDSDEEGDGANSSTRGSGVHSNSSIKNYNASSQSYSNLMQLENAKLQAERLKPIPHIRLSKFQWHQFMEIPIDDLAREITRVDWTMYSSIRPRDFVRHVCLTTEQKRSSRRVDNISMMVKHFNHLAMVVSGMILLRDKPKHRARALEKFMALAWKVRQLNNYNSLGAIVAGINGHEIARLNSTRELVPHEVQRQFLRLTILMGISRSHAAYRMAWDNSFTERIPFLPLIRQDLTMAASANQTFIGSNINWRKFEIMGDVIVGIQKSLEQPYSFGQRTARTEEITRLILETKIVDESEDSADPRSELYDRSIQVEPTGADPRKKFDWLRR